MKLDMKRIAVFLAVLMLAELLPLSGLMEDQNIVEYSNVVSLKQFLSEDFFGKSDEVITEGSGADTTIPQDHNQLIGTVLGNAYIYAYVSVDSREPVIKFLACSDIVGAYDNNGNPCLSVENIPDTYVPTINPGKIAATSLDNMNWYYDRSGVPMPGEGGWVDQGDAKSKNIVVEHGKLSETYYGQVYIVYGEVLQYYTVDFVDVYGNLIERQYVREGENAVPPSAQVVYSVAGYALDSWSGECEYVNHARTIVAMRKYVGEVLGIAPIYVYVALNDGEAVPMLIQTSAILGADDNNGDPCLTVAYIPEMYEFTLEDGTMVAVSLDSMNWYYDRSGIPEPGEGDWVNQNDNVAINTVIECGNLSELYYGMVYIAYGDVFRFYTLDFVDVN